MERGEQVANGSMGRRGWQHEMQRRTGFLGSWKVGGEGLRVRTRGWGRRESTGAGEPHVAAARLWIRWERLPPAPLPAQLPRRATDAPGPPGRLSVWPLDGFRLGGNLTSMGIADLDGARKNEASHGRDACVAGQYRLAS